MKQTEEQKLFYKSILDVLYKYMEFTLSFNKNKSYNYMDILPYLENVYSKLLNKIDNMEIAPQLGSLDSIDFIKELIVGELESLNLFEIYDIQEGLATKDVSNISLALYLKNYINSISEQLNTISGILASYNTSETKYLLSLMRIIKRVHLVTSITSMTINQELMPYYAQSLGIYYHKAETVNTSIFVMMNHISEISAILSLFISNDNIEDINLKDVNGHLDCFNSHKDDINADYPINDLAAALTNFKINLESIINKLKTKSSSKSLQLDVKDIS